MQMPLRCKWEQPWHHSGEFSGRAMGEDTCADSHFCSVNTVNEMARMGLHFIGVTMTVTKQFPMTYLSNLELVQCGDYKRLISKSTDGYPDIMVFVWVNRDFQDSLKMEKKLETKKWDMWVNLTIFDDFC